MNALTLAEEIINGRRITREDDLSFFLTCDLLELCKGADKIRRTANTVHSRRTIIRTVRSMISFRRKRFWQHAK